MTKKLLLVLLIIALILSCFSGCDRKEDSVSEDTTEAVSDKSKTAVSEDTEIITEPVTIRVLGNAGTFDLLTYEIVDELEAKGIIVEGDFYDWSTYNGKQRLAMTARGGEYDLVFLPGSHVNTWAQADALIPVDDFFVEYGYDLSDYYDSVEKFSTSDDKWYIVPFSANVMVYYYRKDIYEDAGISPPKTIDEMYEIAKQLTKDGMYGIAYPGGPGEGACSFWSYFLWSYGGTYFDDMWKPQVNTPEAVESAEMFARILQEAAPRGVSTWQNEETVAAFSSGNVAAMIMWPGFWAQVTNKENSAVWDKVAVAPVPKGPTGQASPRFGAWGLGITATSQNVAAAKEFIAAYTSEEGMRRVAGFTCTASKRINAMEDVRAANPPLIAAEGSLEFADERPPIPEAQQYIEIVGNAINSIVAGLEAQPTLDDANQRIYEMMKEAGYYD